MANRYVLCERDYKRIQAMLRAWEHGEFRPRHRRRSGLTGGGAIKRAKITTSLKYADPDDPDYPDGISAYGAKFLGATGEDDPEITLEGFAREGINGFATGGGDLRNYIRWFVLGDIVPVTLRDGVYYIFQTVIPCGSEAHCSLRWNEDEGRAMAVYK